MLAAKSTKMQLESMRAFVGETAKLVQQLPQSSLYDVINLET